jgi:hypothetical protein
MIISVMNHSKIPDAEVQAALRAINRQIAEDFEPYWDLGATLRLEAKGRGANLAAKRRDAVIFLRDAAGGFHTHTLRGLPYGVVFTEIGKLTKQALPWLTWTSALSHEALELVADPQLNTLVKGPHPAKHHAVFHYREVCDPVQSLTYEIDGILVSNFVLPHYYNAQGERGGRNDHLGSGVHAFRWIEGGYIGFWDPRQGKRGAYVTFPQYKPHHLASKVRRLKGASARLHRYAKRIVREPAR